MPMDARFESGSAGFSVNLRIFSSSSVVRMPKRDASSQGTGMTAMVRSALWRLWLSSIFW